MKTTTQIIILTSFTVLNSLAFELQQGERIVERFHNGAVIEKNYEALNSNGNIKASNVRYTILKPGMHYTDPISGELFESEAKIYASQSGAIASSGQQKIYFSENINTKGAIKIITPNGDVLRQHVLGLQYTDSQNLTTVRFAVIKDSIGEILGENQVLYENAFNGVGVNADIIYTYGIQSFEQDIVIKNVPSPESFGLNSKYVKLEVVSEFLEGTVSSFIKTKTSSKEEKLNDNNYLAISFNGISIVEGKAFKFDRNQKLPIFRNKEDSILVSKYWLTENGRNYLIESVGYDKMRSIFPEGFNQNLSLESITKLNNSWKMPNGMLNSGNPMKQRIKAYNPEAFVIDYIMVNSMPSYTFHSGETYLVSGWVTINNSVTFESGTVIKYDQWSGISAYGTIISPVTEFPAILTAIDDNSVGAPIGNQPLSGTYAYIALDIINADPYAVIQNFNIRHADTAIKNTNPISSQFVENSAFVNCNTGVAFYNADMHLNNLVFCDVTSNIYNIGSSYLYTSNIVNIQGNGDNDGDFISNYEELTNWFTDPLDAFSINSFRKDGEFLLTAVTGQNNTRCSLTLNYNNYDSMTDETVFEFLVDGAFPYEFHSIYVYNSGIQNYLPTYAQYIATVNGLDFYTVHLPGNQLGSIFAAFTDIDIDYDYINDGYEVKILETIVGNADSDGNGIPDGDEDYDNDNYTTIQELYEYATNPLVPESNFDIDNDGIPDWLEIKMGGTASPWDDYDSDGIPNIVEIDIGSSPMHGSIPAPAQIYPNDSNAHIAEFVEFVINDVPYSEAAGPNGDPYFTTGGFSFGPFGVGVGMIVMPSNLTGAGTADVKFYILSSSLLYNFVPPFSDDADPYQLELQKPDPADGAVSGRDIIDTISKVTSIIGPFFDIKNYNQANLQAFRQRTLEYLSVRSTIRVNYYARQIQWLEYSRLNNGDKLGIELRKRHFLNIIHTEMTIRNSVQLRYVTTYSNPFRFIHYSIGAFGVISFVTGLQGQLDDLESALEGYAYDVKHHIDTAGPAILSNTMQRFIGSIPFLPNPAIVIANWGTAPYFDPNPLGWYEGGGGVFEF